MIWRWEKKKIPNGLKEIIVEDKGLNLRNRRFTRQQNWNQDSIAYRLANM